MNKFAFAATMLMTGAALLAGCSRTSTRTVLGAPVYPGCTAVADGRVESASNGYERYAMETPDDFDQVVSFYRSHMKSAKVGQLPGQFCTFRCGSQRTGDTLASTVINVKVDTDRRMTDISVVRSWGTQPQ